MKSFYEKPRKINEINECYFYHSIELPHYGLIKGQWDLRKNIDSYIGKVEVKGKTFFDIGTANGFICFEMEKRGALVTCYDLSEKDDWDIVPIGGRIDENLFMQRKEGKRKVNNAFWLAYNLLNSQAKVIYGSVYDMPSDIGPFDISFLGSILLHLRDPFLALQKTALVTKETIIVTDVVPPGFIGYTNNIISKIKCKFRMCLHHLNEFFEVRPILFAPNLKNQQKTIWWYYSPKMISRFLKILGFENTSISYHYQKFLPKNINIAFYTVVAHKIK